MNQIVIRDGKLNDLPALLSIEQQSFATDRISPRQMRYLLTQAKALTLVIELAAEVVGYGMVFTPKLPRPARLYSLAIDPSWRGRRFAQPLLQQLIQRTAQAGYSHMRLEVRQSQLSVQTLYADAGFVAFAIVPQYYQDGESAIRMQTSLPVS